MRTKRGPVLSLAKILSLKAGDPVRVYINKTKMYPATIKLRRPIEVSRAHRRAHRRAHSIVDERKRVPVLYLTCVGAGIHLYDLSSVVRALAKVWSGTLSDHQKLLRAKRELGFALCESSDERTAPMPHVGGPGWPGEIDDAAWLSAEKILQLGHKDRVLFRPLNPERPTDLVPGPYYQAYEGLVIVTSPAGGQCEKQVRVPGAGIRLYDLAELASQTARHAADPAGNAGPPFRLALLQKGGGWSHGPEAHNLRPTTEWRPLWGRAWRPEARQEGYVGYSSAKGNLEYFNVVPDSAIGGFQFPPGTEYIPLPEGLAFAVTYETNHGHRVREYGVVGIGSTDRSATGIPADNHEVWIHPSEPGFLARTPMCSKPGHNSWVGNLWVLMSRGEDGVSRKKNDDWSKEPIKDCLFAPRIISPQAAREICRRAGILLPPPSRGELIAHHICRARARMQNDRDDWTRLIGDYSRWYTMSLSDAAYIYGGVAPHTSRDGGYHVSRGYLREFKNLALREIFGSGIADACNG